LKAKYMNIIIINDTILCRCFFKRFSDIRYLLVINGNLWTACVCLCVCVCALRCAYRFTPPIEGMETLCNYTMHFWVRLQGLPYCYLRYGVPTLLVSFHLQLPAFSRRRQIAHLGVVLLSSRSRGTSVISPFYFIFFAVLGV